MHLLVEREGREHEEGEEFRRDPFCDGKFAILIAMVLIGILEADGTG